MLEYLCTMVRSWLRTNSGELHASERLRLKPNPVDMPPQTRLPAATMYTRLYSLPRMPTTGTNSACRHRERPLSNVECATADIHQGQTSTPAAVDLLSEGL